MRLNIIYQSTDIYGRCRSFLSSELINITYVLLELLSVRDRGLYLRDIDDALVRFFIDCIGNM